MWLPQFHANATQQGESTLNCDSHERRTQPKLYAFFVHRVRTNPSNEQLENALIVHPTTTTTATASTMVKHETKK